MRASEAQRYCNRGHDTFKHGRYESGNCIKCHKAIMAKRDRRRRIREREEGAPPERVDGLYELRRSRGVTVSQVAWECHNLNQTQLQMIEAGTRYATYAERVEIFQAFNVLEARREEEREAIRELQRRREWAGVA